MTGYVPPGTLPLATVLAQLAEAWMPEAWADSPPAERGVLLGEDLRDFQRRSALRSGSVADLTYARLRPMLADGRLPALLHVKVGPPRPISPASWQADGVSDLRALLDGHLGFALEGGAIERGAVLVAEDALAALLEGRAVPMPVASHAEPVQAPEPKRNPGGRPPKFNAALFLGIAARLHYLNDVNTPSELRKAALDEYSVYLPALNEGPTEAWAKPLIRDYWRGYHDLNDKPKSYSPK